MTDTLERELRRTLADHALADPGAHRDATDPWDRVQRGLVTRRRRRAGAVAGSLALVVAVGGGLAVTQPWSGGATDRDVAEVAGDPRQGATWSLDDGEARGALAGDEDLRAGVEARLTSELAAAGDDPAVVPGSTRLLYADDLHGTRLVVGVADAEGAGPTSQVAIRLVGAAGAPADRLDVQDGVGAVDGLTWPVVGTVTGGDEPALVAVVPRGAEVSVSQAAVVEADGTVSREWEPAGVSDDGVVDVALDDPVGHGLAVLRIDSAPGFVADGPVVEDARSWPAEDLDGLAAKVAERGPREFRDPLTDVAGPLVVDDVRGAAAAVGVPEVDDVELLYAAAAGADVDRGAGGWSSLVATRVGDGSLVTWQLHDAEGRSWRLRGSTVGEGAVDERVLRPRTARRRAGGGRDLGPDGLARQHDDRRRGRLPAARRRVPVVPGGGRRRGPGRRRAGAAGAAADVVDDVAAAGRGAPRAGPAVPDLTRGSGRLGG